MGIDRMHAIEAALRTPNVDTSPSLSTATDHVSGRAVKRKRDNEVQGNAAQAADNVPAGWRMRVDAARPLVIPVPTVITHLETLFARGLEGYGKAVQLHQTAVMNLDRFNRESDGGSIPEYVSRSLQAPAFTFSPSIAEAAKDAIKDAEEHWRHSLVVAQRSATTFVRARHEVNVLLHADRASKTSRVTAFVTDASVFATRTLTGVSRGANEWQPFIEAVGKALEDRLIDIHADVNAQLIAEQDKRLAKASTVRAANADIEMAEAVKTVDELVKEKVTLQVASMKKDLLDQIAKAQASSTSTAPSSPKKKKKKMAKTDDSMKNATASSSGTPSSSTTTHATTSSGSKKPKKDKSGGGGNGKEKQTVAEAKKKGKAKAKENDDA